MDTSIIILAAGQGTRMRSDLPKVLHKLAGKTLLEHVVSAVEPLDTSNIYIVYGYGGDLVRETLSHLDVQWVEQVQQAGTGHAVNQVVDRINDNHLVIILYGDTPLITTGTIKNLIQLGQESGFCLLTSYLDNPAGYGRIIRDDNQTVIRIVEETDANPDEKQINEINTGIMAIPAEQLKKWVGQLDNNNAKKEYYLTDIISMAVGDNIVINTMQPDSTVEIQGINDHGQLSEMERYYQLIQAHQLMHNGMTLMDPARFDLRGELEFGRDIVVDINVILEGRMKIGDRVIIGANSIIRNSIIYDNVEILPNCVIENAVIGKGCRIGPYSRIRPDSVLDEDVHIGNFVEVKKSSIGKSSKINHLSYIGDSEVGDEVNIGAGTITCNYDGAYKHKTIIEDNVFIGSDTQLVAPVIIKAGATIAAGTTVTSDVDAQTLAISRTTQKSVPGWKRPTKKDN